MLLRSPELADQTSGIQPPATFTLPIDAARLNVSEILNRFPQINDEARENFKREVAHPETNIGGTIDCRTATMDIADYLKLGGQTAGTVSYGAVQRRGAGEIGARAAKLTSR